MIKKFFKSALPAVVAMLALAFMGGCADPSPGEIGLLTTVEGQPRSCMVQVFNAKGKQIQEERADEHGVVYIKALPPDTYTLKFKGAGDKKYAAVRTVIVKGGSSPHLDVDLDQAEDKAGEAAASAGGGGGGGGSDD